MATHPAKDDDRPRHVRIAEQELQKGGRVQVDPESEVGRIRRNGQTVTTVSRSEINDILDGIDPDLTRQIVEVRNGMFSGLAESSSTQNGAPRESAETASWASTRKIADEYAIASQSVGLAPKLYHASRRGEIERDENGRYRMDDELEAFLEEEDVIGTDLPDADEEQEMTGEAVGDVSSPEPRSPNVVDEEAGASATTNEGAMPNADGPSTGTGDLVDAVSSAGADYLQALAGPESDRQKAREDLEAARAQLADAMRRAGRVLQATDRLMGVSSPSLDDILSSIEEDADAGTPKLAA